MLIRLYSRKLLAMRIFCLIILLVTSFLSPGQKQVLSGQAEISILTCGPGNTLYTAFGHSAFRVNDPSNKLDIVFNYGTYDFEAPNFYPKFIMGKAWYRLSINEFKYFQLEYQQEKRWVKAQLLKLDSVNKQQLFNFLNTNALPQNSNYLYDYFYDNCSSKIRDVLVATTGNKIAFHDNYLMYKYTHRDLIRQYMSDNSWGGLGIQMALGAVIDRKITSEECAFLPDYIFDSFSNAVIKIDDEAKPMVKKVVEILPGNNDLYKSPYLSPMVVFSIIGTLVLWLTWKDYRNQNRNQWLDFLVLFSTGLIGIALLFLWLVTDHMATANNLNVLWAFAPNFVMAFITLRRSSSVYFRSYSFILLSLLILLLIAWIFKVQTFSTALLPVFFFLGIRYLFLWRLGYRY